MAGVYAQAEFGGALGGRGVGGGGAGVACGEMLGVGGRIELDAIDVEFGSEVHGVGNRVHKDADATAEGF